MSNVPLVLTIHSGCVSANRVLAWGTVSGKALCLGVRLSVQGGGALKICHSKPLVDI